MSEQVKLSDWDIDLRYGQQGEIYVNNLLASPIETVECKRDRRWRETGNLFIETHCYSSQVGTWYESGISITRATHWAFILDDNVLIFPTSKIKAALLPWGHQISMTRDEYSTKGYLLPIMKLVTI